MKNSNDTIGNRTRDLPACSAVRQLTASPRAPHSTVIKPEISRDYVTSKDFSSSAIPVHVLREIKKLIGKFVPVPSMKAHIM